MADLKDLIVNGAARIIGKTYSSEFVGNVTGDVTGNLTGNAATASKLGTATVGGDTKPIYLKGGVATAVGNPVIPLVSNGDMSGADVSTVQGAGVLLRDETTGTVWNIHTHANNLRMYDGSTEKILSENGHTHSYAGSSSVGGPATDFTAEAANNGDNKERYVYFAYNNSTYNNSDPAQITKGRAVVDSAFTYNSGTDTLTAGTFKGNLAASNITGTLGVGHGGTGIASFTAGDILYASGTSTLAALNKGTDGQVLKLSGGKPAWGTDNTPTNFAWTNGTTAGPTGSLTGNGMSAVNFAAIPSASESASGIVTTGTQTFGGEKTFSATTASSSTTTGAVKISGGLGVAGHIYAGAVHNAVWNDLVDCMEVPEDTSLEFGYCYSWKDDSVIKSSRSSKNCIGIHSNTAGFVMGEKKTKTIQAAVAGFVLAYVDKLYPEGTPLTWGDNGTLTKCSLLKRILHPERIIATFYKEEKEEKWHNLPVSGRHWVKIV